MTQVKIMNQSGNPLPKYQTAGSAGMDIQSDSKTDIIIEAGQTGLIPTGLFIELPEHLEAQIRPRSGLAFKHGITVLNAPGTIDSDYRGEIKVLLINHSQNAFTVQFGDRIAQMVIAPVCQIAWQLESSLSETKRGSGGYGHTGT